MLTITTQSSINLPMLVKSDRIGTIALVGSQNSDGSFNMTIIKPGKHSSTFVGQYIDSTYLHGYSIIPNANLVIRY